jgi:uncharacterized protein YoxC
MSREMNMDVTPDESINSDVIRKITEHHYFQTLLKEQVNAQTQAYVSRWWKIIAAIAFVVLTILGFFGVKEFLSFKEKVAEIEKENERVKGLVGESNNLLKQAQTLGKTATDTVSLADKYVESSRVISQDTGNLAKQTGAFTEQLLNSLGQRESELKKAHSELEQDLRRSNGDIVKIRQEKEAIERLKVEIAGISDMIRTQETTIAGTSSAVKKRGEDVEKSAAEIAKTAESLQKSLDVQQEIAKAKTFEIVVIRQGRNQGSTVKLPDFRDVNNKGGPRQYTLKFTAVRIKNQTDIDVQVDSGDVQNFRNLQKGNSRSLEGAPFYFRVDSIYHAKLAFDFVVLRVNPKAG